MTRRQTNRLYILLTVIVLMSGILLYQISTTFEAAELEKTVDVEEDTEGTEELIDVENEDIRIQEVTGSKNIVQVYEEETPKANMKVESFFSRNKFILSGIALAGVVIIFVVHEKHKKSDEEDFTI